MGRTHARARTHTHTHTHTENCKCPADYPTTSKPPPPPTEATNLPKSKTHSEQGKWRINNPFYVDMPDLSTLGKGRTVMFWLTRQAKNRKDTVEVYLF